MGTIRDTPGVWFPGHSGGRVLKIEIDHSDSGLTICRPVGELDAFTVSQFRQALAELASPPDDAGPGEDGNPRSKERLRLLIDMSGVPFVDSAGLGALIGGIRRARELGGDVAVACNRPTLTRLLRTTGFDRIVTVAETIEEAAKALEGEATQT
jgi:anti-sigma B factor antagonist